MCGIIGYIGKAEKKKIILDGLGELEYRGYDSAGMAILQDSKLESFKAVGRLSNLGALLESRSFEGLGLALGHTRWATHGSPSEANAHPHSTENTAIIHNGIIENHRELKQELLDKGIRFSSQTDSEVIVHLYEWYARELSAKEAFEATLRRLRGAYAILLISTMAPDRIFYARCQSPLLIGLKWADLDSKNRLDGVFFSSSEVALLGLVDSALYLGEGELGCLALDDLGGLDLARFSPLKGEKSKAEKDGYRYFMEKEIYQQESVLFESTLGRVSKDKVELEELDSKFFDSFDSIAICACGTSYHSALVGKYLLERKACIRTTTHIASEFRYAKPVLEKNELFIAISQSGETADTLQALRLAKQKGLTTLVICNVDSSSMVRLADYCLLTRAGIERGVASTKAFATQVMILWILAVVLGQRRGRIDSVGLRSESKALLNAVKATRIKPALHEKIKRLSKRYLHGHGFFFIGRDVFYPLALEGALKLKEVSYLHAEGYPSGEMKHGPLALADSKLFTLALMPKNLLYEKNKSNVEELVARDSTVCAISALDFDLADDMVKIPHFDSYMEEFFSMMVVLQLLALEIAIRLNNDVDMPRNLAKSVTVE